MEYRGPLLSVSLRSTHPTISATISAMTVHLKRGGAEQLPAVALQHVGELDLAHRCEIALSPVLLLDEAARLSRRVDKQDAAGVGAGALPGMRDIARHEGAGAGAADRDRVADQKRDLALQDVGDLVAVVMQMEGALGSGRNGFLEHHDAVAGRAAQQLQRIGAARRGVAVRYQAFSRLYDDALCGHGSLLSRVPQSGDGPTISHW